MLFNWQGQKDSNPRHAVLETAALPTELYPYKMAEKMGFEPMLPLSNTNGLANRPLQPLEYFSLLVKFPLRCVAAPDLARSRTQVRSLRLDSHAPCAEKISLRNTIACHTVLSLWRRGWDSNPRSLSGSLVFKTSSINRSDTSPDKASCRITPHALEMVTHPRFELGTP